MASGMDGVPTRRGLAAGIGTIPRRQALAAALVARRLLSIPEGERIPTIAELAAEAGTGTGTVQAALKLLTEDGALELSRRGHLGTVLVRRDLGRLWGATSAGPVIGILPLPGSIEFSGLATAISAAFRQAEVPLSLAFRLGSRSRLEFLTSGAADFIACSLAFAQTLDPERFALLDLGPATYYTRNSVCVVTRAGEEPDPHGRVAVDRLSHDHEARTKAEFPDAELIQCAYPQIPSAVLRGEVDAAVWHRTSASPIEIASGLAIHETSRPVPEQSEELSHAVLVTLADSDSPAKALLDEVIDPAEAARIAADVVAQKRVPEF